MVSIKTGSTQWGVSRFFGCWFRGRNKVTPLKRIDIL